MVRLRDYLLMGVMMLYDVKVSKIIKVIEDADKKNKDNVEVCMEIEEILKDDGV